MSSWRNAAHPEESWLLVKWLTTSEVGARWFMFVQGRPSPVRRYSLDRSYFTSNPHWPTIIQAMETSVPLPRIPIEDRLKQVESRFLTPAFSGTMAPRQVLTSIKDTPQALLEEYYAPYSGSERRRMNRGDGALDRYHRANPAVSATGGESVMKKSASAKSPRRTVLAVASWFFIYAVDYRRHGTGSL